MRAALPIVLGYLPVGMAFGVLARKAGLTPLEAGGMSLLVYAGASQFIAVEMISKGALWLPILLTTFFVNLRHFLMSSTLALQFNRHPFKTFALMAAQLTDESFALVMSDVSRISNRPGYLFGIQMISHLAWIGGSVGGALFGELIGHESVGLPFALPALFICLLVLQMKSLHLFGVMILAGIFSILVKGFLPGHWYIPLAALLASGIGVMMKTLWKERG
jgi:4-azaleucine resistance transporter AzlC